MEASWSSDSVAVKESPESSEQLRVLPCMRTCLALHALHEDLLTADSFSLFSQSSPLKIDPSAFRVYAYSSASTP